MMQLRIPYAKGSHTSRKGAEAQSSNRNRGVKIAHLMLLYRRAGETGMIDAEAADALSAAVGATVPVSSITSLRGALMEEGLVGKGAQRMGKYGLPNSAYFWLGKSV